MFVDTETTQTLDKYAQDKYKYGFVTEIESDRPKKGLNEETIKFISKKKKTNLSGCLPGDLIVIKNG